MTLADVASTDLVVVANRLPFRRLEDGSWLTSPGGLIAALAPALDRARSLRWVGWAGDVSDGPLPGAEVDGMHLAPVWLTADDKKLSYDGMSNGTLWPLYHDKAEPSEFTFNTSGRPTRPGHAIGLMPVERHILSASSHQYTHHPRWMMRPCSLHPDCHRHPESGYRPRLRR